MMVTRLSLGRDRYLTLDRLDPFASFDAVIDLGETFGRVSRDDLYAAAERFRSQGYATETPQLAFLAFALTRNVATLNHYFFLSRGLDDISMRRFYARAAQIGMHDHLQVSVFDDQGTEIDLPEIRFLIACHLTEIFYGSPEILDWLLRVKCRFLFYKTQKAYADAGGVGGGCYRPDKNAIQMLLSRLFEGYSEKEPGVAPLLHELGHMLDHSSGALGLLPRMNARQKVIFDADMRDLFTRGKQIEAGRYELLRLGKAHRGMPVPIGGPYTLSNNGEFIAGYVEMFFRNPHYFEKNNATLYEAFRRVFNIDPRAFWKRDFQRYINENRDAYARKNSLPPLKITISD
jgi:hypothetical protein